jgi:K+-sensing histidine kinase KdpD
MYPYHLIGQYDLTAPTTEQLKKAQEVLTKTSADLQRQGFSHTNIEMITRVGSPAEEIVKLAREHHANVIIIGNRGNSWQQQIRRILWGSISHQVLQLAPCPVIMVVPPQPHSNKSLIAWYEQEAKSYLDTHTSSLVVLTPDTITKLFPLPRKQPIEQKEIEAATLALEKLATQGILCRRDIQGQIRYIND